MSIICQANRNLPRSTKRMNIANVVQILMSMPIFIGCSLMVKIAVCLIAILLLIFRRIFMRERCPRCTMQLHSVDFVHCRAQGTTTGNQKRLKLRNVFRVMEMVENKLYWLVLFRFFVRCVDSASSCCRSITRSARLFGSLLLLLTRDPQPAGTAAPLRNAQPSIALRRTTLPGKAPLHF